jgi:hypothetical protein
MRNRSPFWHFRRRQRFIGNAWLLAVWFGNSESHSGVRSTTESGETAS